MKLYPLMNEAIVDLLRLTDRQDCHYAAELIEQLRAELAKANEQGIVCSFCGESWPYEPTDGKPPQEILHAAVEHEKVCPKNPYLARIAQAEQVIYVSMMPFRAKPEPFYNFREAKAAYFTRFPRP